MHHGAVSLVTFRRSPRNNRDIITATTPNTNLEDMLSRAADVLVGGHTHTPRLRRYHGSLLLNPGRVGLALVSRGMEWNEDSWNPLRRLGYLALGEQDVDRAVMLYLESMEVNREVGDRQGVAAYLIGLATVTEARGQLDRATRFLGAADALVESIQTQLLPFGNEEFDGTVATLRGQLAAATFAAARVEGRAMTAPQAIAAAVEWATSVSLEHQRSAQAGS